MSFLLDALGKADDDRRRSAVPELRASGWQRNTPKRSLFRVVLLLVVVLVSFAMGFFSRPYFEPGYTISIVRDAQNIATSSKQGSEKPSLERPNMENSEKVSQDEIQPPLSAPIELSVISYSSVPIERFAMLNGFLMYEGDILSAGERLIEIKADSVVLEKDGRQYTLSMAISPRR